MLCETIAPWLSARVDGELRGVRAWQVRRHLACCPDCQQELAQLNALNVQLERIAPLPLPARLPVSRPIGLVRPTLAALALASVALVLVRLQPRPATLPATAPAVAEAVTPTLPPAPEALSAPKQVALATAKTAPRVRRATLRAKRASRRTPRRRRQHFAEAAPEQIIVVATRLTPPEPVTVVLNDKDDEGGTIHIESTIPAAYVVALQKEKL